MSISKCSKGYADINLDLISKQLGGIMDESEIENHEEIYPFSQNKSGLMLSHQSRMNSS